MAEATGLEPITISFGDWRSTNWTTPPNQENYLSPSALYL
jgi:hypothetical protein